MRILNLDYNTIGDYGAGCLAVTLASNNNLETLDLEGTGISEFGAQVSFQTSATFQLDLSLQLIHLMETTLNRIIKSIYIYI